MKKPLQNGSRIDAMGIPAALLVGACMGFGIAVLAVRHGNPPVSFTVAPGRLTIPARPATIPDMGFALLPLAPSTPMEASHPFLTMPPLYNTRPAVQPPPAAAPATRRAATRPEDSLVYSGFTAGENGLPTEAYIQDLNTLATIVVKPGGKVTPNIGVITNIQFGSLDYTGTDGHKVRVLIGQNLVGSDHWRHPNLETGVAPPIDPTGSSADVLRRLQLKRQQELQQINGSDILENPTVSP